MAQRQRRSASKAPSSSLKPFYIALAVIALGGVGWIFYSLASAGEPAVAPIELAGLDDPAALLAAAKGSELGQPDAPVQILIFSDYTCPSCQYWVQTVEPLVKQEFIDAGKARLVHYDFPLGGTAQHRHSFIAARAARCAEAQGRFWDYHDILFGRQGEWSPAPEPPIDEFVGYANQLGLDRRAFSDCLRSDQFADVVSASRQLGESLNVGATPTVYIGPRTLPGNEWSQYPAVKAAIEAELGGS